MKQVGGARDILDMHILESAVKIKVQFTNYFCAYFTNYLESRSDNQLKAKAKLEQGAPITSEC